MYYSFCLIPKLPTLPFWVSHQNFFVSFFGPFVPTSSNHINFFISIQLNQHVLHLILYYITYCDKKRMDALGGMERVLFLILQIGEESRL